MIRQTTKRNGSDTLTARVTLTDTVGSELRRSILAGEYAPGDRITVHELAADLGTSLTPAREALMKLVAERVLENVSGQFRIPVLTRERYIEVCLIRRQLEALAAESAATRISKEELAQARVFARKYIHAVEKSDVRNAMQYNVKFKFELYRASRMPTLTSLIEGLMLQVAPLFLYVMTPLSNATTQFDKVSVARVTDLLNALKQRDPEAAGNAVRGIIDAAMARTLRIFDEPAHDELTEPAQIGSEIATTTQLHPNPSSRLTAATRSSRSASKLR